jgi:hypothetical protein
MKYYTDFFLLFHGHIERGNGLAVNSTNHGGGSIFGNAYCSLFEHAIAYLHALYGYARVCFLLQKVYECEQYLQKYLACVRYTLGENHYYYAIGLSFQSALLFSLKRNDQAKVWMTDCLQILQKNLGLMHPFTGVACHNLGVLTIKVEGLNAGNEANTNASLSSDVMAVGRTGEEFLDQAEHVLEMNAGSCQEEIISLRLNQAVILAMQIDDFNAVRDSDDGKRVQTMKNKIQQCRSLMTLVGLGEDHPIAIALRKLDVLLPNA